MEQRMRHFARILVATAMAASALMALPREAAAVDCTTLPNRVYGIGGSAFKPLLAKVAAQLAGGANPVTILYQAPGGCSGVQAMIADPPTKLSGTISYWTPDGVEHQCDLPVAGVTPNFGNSGAAATTCDGVSALPATVGDFEGPVTSVQFFVPVASSQQSISAEAAYFVYGFGQPGQASPWTEDSEIITRDETSAVGQIIAHAIKVPANRLVGVNAMQNQRSVTLVSQAADPEAAIGFASGDVADANRAQVRTLAYQHFGQDCGYWPDSDANSFDKINVRNGSYFIWVPTHFFAIVDGSGTVADQPTRDFIGLFTGQTAPPAGIDILRSQVDTGNIPKCAMNVWRDSDLGPLYSYQAPEPCGCFFEAAATGATSCTACSGDTDCPSAQPKCRQGYCEVQ
jgi:hypothetical protein